MKKISLSLLFLLLLSGFTSLAQEEKQPPVTLTKTEGSGFTYDKVIDNLELFCRSIKWLVLVCKYRFSYCSK